MSPRAATGDGTQERLSITTAAVRRVRPDGGDLAIAVELHSLTGHGRKLVSNADSEKRSELIGARGFNIWDENAPWYKQVFQAVRYLWGDQASPVGHWRQTCRQSFRQAYPLDLSLIVFSFAAWAIIPPY